MSKPTLVILAGGKGTRLGDLTKETPKPMVGIFGRPFLYWLIKHYVSQGFTDIIISTGYKPEVIEAYPWPWELHFEQDAKPGKPCVYHTYWSNNIVVNGDTWIDDPLPEHGGPWILSCGDVDAGAQYPGAGCLSVIKTCSFIDIGTPDGLERFKEYFKSHPLYVSSLTQGIP